MSTDVRALDVVDDTTRHDDHQVTRRWPWLVALGAVWVWFGTFVLSFRVGSLVAVTSFVGAAFLLGGITQLLMSSRIPSLRWLSILSGALGVVAGVLAFAWPDVTLYVVSVMVAWYLIAFGTIHIVNALAGPKLSLWWSGLLLGIAELVLGVWAARSWEHSVVTLVTLVGVWAICRGVAEVFAGFAVRQADKQLDALVT